MPELTTDVAPPCRGEESEYSTTRSWTPWLGCCCPTTAFLDFGCGAGMTVRTLQGFGYVNAVGCDVADGRPLAEPEHGDIRAGRLLDLRLPYEDDTFNLVLADRVFEHV